MLRSIAVTTALAVAASVTAAAQEQPAVERQRKLVAAEIEEARTVFERLAEDYRTDPMAIDGIFGIRLADRFWTVEIAREETATRRGRLTDHAFGPHRVTLSDGKPERPTFLYVIANMDVLRLIATGEVNAGTAAMQSFGSDQVGVETDAMEGFEMTSGAEAELYHHMSHFFTTGIPEITYFGAENSLETHGAQMTALHFMKGVRIGYFTLEPSQTANEDVRLQKGQMPNLFIVTKGRGIGHLGDRKIELKPGMSVFIPPFVRHEFTAVGDEPMEGIVVLYGDNSDFAFGTSYPAFLQDLYGFYGSYPFREQEDSGQQ